MAFWGGAWHRYDPLDQVYDALYDHFRELHRREFGGGFNSDSDDDSEDDPYFDEFFYGLNFVIQEPEDLRVEPAALERELRRTPLADECALLTPWFRVLGSSLLPYKIGIDQRDTHDVRVGRDECDLWIHLTTFVVRSEAHDAVYARTFAGDARLQREALYVTSLLGEIDHGAWLGELLRTSAVDFRVPMDMNLEQCELPRQYDITIYDDDTANRVQLMFTDNAPLSVAFRKAFAKLSALATTRKNVCLNQHPFRVPIRLCVNVSQSTPIACAVRWLRTVETIIQVTKEQPKCGLIGPAMLRPVDIELDLGNATISVALLSALERVIATGVRVRLLGLPRFAPPNAIVQDPEELLLLHAEMQISWSSFVRAVFVGSASIDTVKVNLKDMSEDFVGPFFSAVMHARRVRRVMFSETPQHHATVVWIWMAFAMFSRESSSSISSLGFVDSDWRDGVLVDYVDAFARAQDPIGVLWRLAGSPQSMSTTPTREVYLHRGTVVTVVSKTINSVATLRLAWDAVGVVVEDDDINEGITVLIAGVGFCRVNPSSLGSKKRRVETTTPQAVKPSNRRRFGSLHTLMVATPETAQPRRHAPHAQVRLSEGAEQTRHQLSRLLRLIGPSLSSLALASNAVDDSTVETMSQHCRQLQNLRISRASVRSLTPIVEMCRRSLGSLDLHGVTVPVVQLEEFLESQRTSSPRNSALRRLRFGRDGMCDNFRYQTGEIVRSVLRENKLLTHVQIFVPHRSLPPHFGRRQFHAEPLPIDPMPVASRIALLSVPNILSIDRPVLTEIFEFAASSGTWRRMAVNRDTQHR